MQLDLRRELLDDGALRHGARVDGHANRVEAVVDVERDARDGARERRKKEARRGADVVVVQVLRHRRVRLRTRENARSEILGARQRETARRGEGRRRARARASNIVKIVCPKMV